MQMKDVLLEKEILFQETNTHLAEQISKVFSESKRLEVLKNWTMDNITSPETTSVSPNSFFFSFLIILLLLIIQFPWSIIDQLYSFISFFNEKNLTNYKIPFDRNQRYDHKV